MLNLAYRHNKAIEQFLGTEYFWDYFGRANQIKPGNNACPWLRVSGWEQGNHWSLHTQLLVTSIAIEFNGGNMPIDPYTDDYPFRFVWSGRGAEWWKKVNTASLQAKSLLASFVPTMVDRVARHFDFDSRHETKWLLQASPQDLDKFKEASEHVPFLPYLSPTTTPGECRSKSTKWGLALQTACEGNRESFRNYWAPVVATFRKNKISYSQICKRIEFITKRHLGPKTLIDWAELATRQSAFFPLYLNGAEPQV